MLRRISLLATFASLAWGQSAAPPPGNPDWYKPFPPFKIIGNVYWVGTWDLSTYLITTPQGNILINTGMPETLSLIKSGVEQLGFKLTDTKILLATHAHSDHVAAMAELKKMTGAKFMMSEPDTDVVESGGKTDFRFGDDARMRFQPAMVDQKLKDGEKISLGGTVLTAHINAGHTKGATSFTFDVKENGKTYKVGIINMGSINPGVKVSGMPKFPGITTAYARTFHDQKEMKIDVWLASHAAQFKLHDKYKPGDAYNPDRFVDPKGFHEGVLALEKTYTEQLAKEKEGK